MEDSNYSRSLRMLILLFLAMSIARFSHYLIIDSTWYNYKHFLKYEFLQLMLATLLSLPLIFLRRYYAIYNIILAVFILFIGLEFTHILLFSSYPNSATYFTLFSTNYYESTEFIVDYIGIKIIAQLCLFLFSLWLMNRLITFLFHRYLEGRSKRTFLGLSFSTLALFIIMEFFGKLYPLSITSLSVFEASNSLIEYLDDRERLNTIANQHIEFSSLEYEDDGNAHTHIIVIGESTSKHHMSLYGYSRITNPLLGQEKFILLKDAASPNAHTVQALEKALTFKTRSNEELGLEEGSLIDLANQIGYSTYWISNQGFSGKNETPISVMASKTDFKAYTNPIGTAPVMDIETLNHLEKALSDENKNKLIFIHLMGTHLSYSERYPDAYEKFTDDFHPSGLTIDQEAQNFINSYDNAILYNDYVVHQLLQLAQKEDKAECTFTYFSDHGDEVYDFRYFHGHFDDNPSKYMYEIPLLFWFNDKFEEHNSKKISVLSQHISDRFNTENLIHFFADVLRAYPSYYSPKNSPFSAEFEEND